MNREQSRTALKSLLKVALPAVEALPPSERADAYEGIAVACRGVDPSMHELALKTSQTLRDAEGAQLIFRQLLS